MAINTMREMVEEAYEFFSHEMDVDNPSHDDNLSHAVQEDGNLTAIDKESGKTYTLKKFTSERMDEADGSIQYWLEIEEN